MINWTSFETNCKRVEAQFKALYESSINLRGLDRSPYSKAHKKVYDSNIQILKQCIEYANKIAENEEEDLPFSEYGSTSRIDSEITAKADNSNIAVNTTPMINQTNELNESSGISISNIVTQTILGLYNAGALTLSTTNSAPNTNLQIQNSALANTDIISTSEQDLINYVLGNLISYYKNEHRDYTLVNFYTKPTFASVHDMLKYNEENSNTSFVGKTHIDYEILQYARMYLKLASFPQIDSITYPELTQVLKSNSKIIKELKTKLKHSLNYSSKNDDDNDKKLRKEEQATSNKELRNNLKYALAHVRAKFLSNSNSLLLKTIFCRIEEWYNLRFSLNLRESNYIFSKTKLKDGLECMCWMYGSLFAMPEHNSDYDAYNVDTEITQENLLIRKFAALHYNFDTWARHIDNEQDSLRSTITVPYLAHAFSTVTPIEKLFKDKAVDEHGNYVIKDAEDITDSKQIYPIYIDENHSIGFVYWGVMYKRTLMAIWLLYQLYIQGVPGISLESSKENASVLDMISALVFSSLQDPETVHICQNLNTAINENDTASIEAIMHTIYATWNASMIPDEDDNEFELLDWDNEYKIYLNCKSYNELCDITAIKPTVDITHGHIYSPYTYKNYSVYLWRYYAKSILRPQYITEHDNYKKQLLYPKTLMNDEILDMINDSNILEILINDSELNSDLISRWEKANTPNDYQMTYVTI